jgi:ubiquinone biosynthesis protein
VAQVHNAVLPDGTPAVVKVRRPGIELQVDEDLAILGHIARFLSQNTEFGKKQDLEGLLDEFAYTLRNELDFVREGQNAERIASEFKDDPGLHVPTVYWDFTTRAVLTMEEINGIKIAALDELDAAGINRAELAKRCAHVALVQVLDFGFFHADPHPGNFFVQPDGVIALLDYGMVGRLGENLRGSLLRLSLAISHQDPDRLVDELLAMGAASALVDREKLTREIERLLAQFDGVPLGAVSAAQVFREVAGIAQRHGLTLPSDLIVLARVIAMDEGLGAMLDPDFKLIEFAKPYFKRFWLKNHSPRATLRRVRDGVMDLADLAADLPERLRRLSGMIERGEVTVTSRVEVQPDLTKQLQQAANRISMSVLTAGLIVGLSVMTLVYRPTGSEGLAYLLLKALLAVGIASAGWLLVANWKSTR